VADARDQCLIELLYGCGLRVGELVGLDVDGRPPAVGWVDAQAGDVHVLGKGGKRRSVPVGAPALAALAAWLVLRPQWAPSAAQAAADERRGDGSRALFINRRGTRLTAHQARQALAQRTRQAGLATAVHPHMLRHSFASHVLQSSSDLRGVQELLGHANISTTQVYTRLDFQHLAKAYDAAHPRARRKDGG
jgi:integrase/recombinase XerC